LATEPKVAEQLPNTDGEAVKLSERWPILQGLLEHQ
jgi:hypothetical protein